jgi:hypothetical protein
MSAYCYVDKEQRVLTIAPGFRDEEIHKCH